MGAFTSSSSPSGTDDSLKLYQDYFSDRIRQNKIVIFSQTTCGYCSLAKDLFDRYNAKYQTIELNVNDNCPQNDCKLLKQVLTKRTGMRTVPQIFIDGKLIGGYTELNNLAENGELKKILEK